MQNEVRESLSQSPSESSNPLLPSYRDLPNNDEIASIRTACTTLVEETRKVQTEKREVLLQDYQKTLDVIHKQVDTLFKIREWAVLSCSAVIAYGVSQGSYWILVANLPLTIGLCLIELFFKEFHDACLRRAEELEGIIQAITFNDESIKPSYIFGVGHTFRDVARERTVKSLLSPSNIRASTKILYGMILLMTAGAMLLIRLIK